MRYIQSGSGIDSHPPSESLCLFSYRFPRLRNFCSLYRAVDKTGQTLDFLLTEQRDEHAAKRCLTKAICLHGVPETITIDGSAANEAAIKSYNAGHGTAITSRKRKYLNTVVEQDHRAVIA